MWVSISLGLLAGVHASELHAAPSFPGVRPAEFADTEPLTLHLIDAKTMVMTTGQPVQRLGHSTGCPCSRPDRFRHHIASLLQPHGAD